MKFGEQLASHLTPEWRKQYIRYEELKSLLYDMMLEVPAEEDAREQYISQMDEKFFAECEQELTKISLFFSQKIAEAQGKYHELNSELVAFKEFMDNTEGQKAINFSANLRNHWRINKVEKSSFFLNREIETLISNVETSVINELEGGNRQAGMKRLKVPPLSEKQHSTTTFSLGLFLGAFIVLAIAILLTWFGAEVRRDEPKWVAVRLFRGPLLFFVCIWLCGLNMYGWAAAVLGYLYAHLIHLPPFLFPMLLMIVCMVILFNPLKKPDSIFRRNSRFWLLKHCFNCFTAPLHFVTFPDFWLGDQMNSLTTSFLDLQYFVCFYATEVDYSGWTMTVRAVNLTINEPVPWGYVDMNTGRDMCTSASGVRALVSIIPATVRFMQCLRRFRDTGRARPHLVNAGKYFTTYPVIIFKSLNHWAEKADPYATSIFFYLWIAAYIISFTYTFLWDVFMDWGLVDPRHVNNCGQFRAVRDISVKPIKKGDLESLISKMDQQDGVTHRGQDLRDRVKKQKKAAKNLMTTLLSGERGDRRIAYICADGCRCALPKRV
uniref:Uncharacterized protein n=1 Tax=Parascaris equorum TaxID=6256 RepID=A0A914RGI3_PAREQ